MLYLLPVRLLIASWAAWVTWSKIDSEPEVPVVEVELAPVVAGYYMTQSARITIPQLLGGCVWLTWSWVWKKVIRDRGRLQEEQESAFQVVFIAWMWKDQLVPIGSSLVASIVWSESPRPVLSPDWSPPEVGGSCEGIDKSGSQYTIRAFAKGTGTHLYIVVLLGITICRWRCWISDSSWDVDSLIICE